MEPKCRLQVVAWLYIAVGAIAAIEFVVGLFTPVSEHLVDLFILSENVNLAMLLLPLGIGLRRRVEICRKLGLILSVLWLPAMAVAGVLFVAAFVFSEVSPANWGLSFDWKVDEDLPTGDAISKTLTFLAICLPLYVWQIRVLWSEATKTLTGPEPENP